MSDKKIIIDIDYMPGAMTFPLSIAASRLEMSEEAAEALMRRHGIKEYKHGWDWDGVNGLVNLVAMKRKGLIR